MFFLTLPPSQKYPCQTTLLGIICSGGGSLPAREFLERLWGQINISKCRGAATGRNIHQKGTEEAVRMTAACDAIICQGATAEQALAIFEGN